MMSFYDSAVQSANKFCYTGFLIKLTTKEGKVLNQKEIRDLAFESGVSRKFPISVLLEHGVIAKACGVNKSDYIVLGYTNSFSNLVKEIMNNEKVLNTTNGKNPIFRKQIMGMALSDLIKIKNPSYSNVKHICNKYRIQIIPIKLLEEVGFLKKVENASNYNVLIDSVDIYMVDQLYLKILNWRKKEKVRTPVERIIEKDVNSNILKEKSSETEKKELKSSDNFSEFNLISTDTALKNDSPEPVKDVLEDFSPEESDLKEIERVLEKPKKKGFFTRLFSFLKN
jgi:hypothetical protein